MKLILYIAQSLDGYIATSDGDISWLSVVESEGEDYGYHSFLSTVDCILIGRRSYEKTKSFGIGYPYGDRMCFVASRSDMADDDFPLVEFVKSIESFANRCDELGFETVYVDGGADLVSSLLKKNMLSEIIVSTVPVMLGGGIRLFDYIGGRKYLTLIESKAFSSGLVQSRYAL